MVCKTKMGTSAEQLCRMVSEPFRRFTDAVIALSFEEAPAYAALRALFEPLLGPAACRPIAVDLPAAKAPPRACGLPRACAAAREHIVLCATCCGVPLPGGPLQRVCPAHMRCAVDADRSAHWAALHVGGACPGPEPAAQPWGSRAADVLRTGM